MAKSLYTAAQRRKAKEKAQLLVTIDVPGFSYQGLLKPGNVKGLLEHAIGEIKDNKDQHAKLKDLGFIEPEPAEPAGAAVATASA